MEIREFLNKFMKATENMSVEEREALLQMFQGVSQEIKKRIQKHIFVILKIAKVFQME